MAKSLIQTVVKQLEQERSRLQGELKRVDEALTTFGKAFKQRRGRRRGPGRRPGLGAPRGGRKRTISAAGRKRIAAAQRARWARVKAAQK